MSSHGVLITSPDGVFELDATVFGEAAATRWATEPRYDTAHAAVAVTVRRPGEPVFVIELAPERSYVSTDATPEQTAEVAAWVRSLLPAGHSPVWLIQRDFLWHAELPAGVTPEQIPGLVVED